MTYTEMLITYNKYHMHPMKKTCVPSLMDKLIDGFTKHQSAKTLGNLIR